MQLQPGAVAPPLPAAELTEPRAPLHSPRYGLSQASRTTAPYASFICQIGVCLRPRTGNAGAVSTTPAGGARGLPWRRARLLFADKAILGRLAIPRAGWARARCCHQGGLGRPGCLAHTDSQTRTALTDSLPRRRRNPMTLKSRTWAPCALPPQICGDIPVEYRRRTLSPR